MDQNTYWKLKQLKLNGMAQFCNEYLADPQMRSLSTNEIINLMVDREDILRKNSRRERLLKKATFEQPNAHISQIDYSEGRMLSRDLVMSLATCEFISNSHNVVLMGATGSGKSYLACAIGNEACKQLYFVRYTRMQTILDDMRIVSELKWSKMKRDLLKCNLLIIDDWMLSPVTEEDVVVLYELIHERESTQGTSTMLCTQYDLKGCAKRMPSKTISDAIYDRLEHNAYVLNLSQNPEFPSMRAKYGVRFAPQ